MLIWEIAAGVLVYVRNHYTNMLQHMSSMSSQYIVHLQRSTIIISIILVIVCLICLGYDVHWKYDIAERLMSNANRRGVPMNISGENIKSWTFFGYFLCTIGTWIAWSKLIRSINALASAYNKGFKLYG